MTPLADLLTQTWVDCVFLVVFVVVGWSMILVTWLLWRVTKLLAILEDDVARRLAE